MAMARTIDINIENNAMKSSKDFEDLADGVGKVDDQVKDLNKNSKGRYWFSRCRFSSVKRSVFK